MKIEYRVVKGSQATRPAEIDTTSSPSTVYLRKEIKRITEVDEQGEETYLWQYEEAELTPEEYEQYSDTLIYQALMEQNEALDAANAMIMLSQANIEAMHADQDETLALILENTTTAEEV